MAITVDEHLDVLIIGAGLSGIGAGCHLRRECPDHSFAILEAREATGGTWDLFRYPGVRSDSDMYTLGYDFEPWLDSRTLADGPSILRYIRQTADRHHVTERVRCGHRVTGASWSGDEELWTVFVERTGTGEELTLTCSFLFTCTGYYRYDHGFTPDFPGIERFAGSVIHPQHWPEDLDYSGKRVVIIGSGATAITLAPAMAPTAAHVTMLQRSPTYVLSIPSTDVVAEAARRRLSGMATYRAIRVKNMALIWLQYQFCRRWPRAARAVLRRQATALAPEGFDVDTHFKPVYDPWDQRLCFCPDGDLYDALGSGRMDIVTDQIESFSERGIVLRSGRELPADIVITATGLDLQALGGARLTVDGREVDLADTIVYRGAMLSGVPNFAFTFGYTNASWTLRADLTARYVCRLLNHMRERGLRRCVPRPSGAIERRPFLDLASGYVRRAVDSFPRQGADAPWRVRQSYPLDALDFKLHGIDDGTLEFASARAPATPVTPAAPQRVASPA
jgi:cation diffusion facilitator CzcD-associated flavoprotein CzcO